MRTAKSLKLQDGRIVRGTFDPVTIALHWATALLVLFQIASGWAMAELGALATFPGLLAFHRSIGITIWAITFGRVLWRRRFASFPPFRADMRRVSKWAAQATEYLLYVLLFVQPLTGALYTLLRGRPFGLFGIAVPPLLARNTDLSELFHKLHICGAYAFASVVAGHALAGLLHHFVRRDDVLEAMAPVFRRRANSSRRASAEERCPALP